MEMTIVSKYAKAALLILAATLSRVVANEAKEDPFLLLQMRTHYSIHELACYKNGMVIQYTCVIPDRGPTSDWTFNVEVSKWRKNQKGNIEYYSGFGNGEWIELRKTQGPQEPENGYINSYDKFLQIVPKLLFFEKMAELRNGKFPNSDQDIVEPWKEFDPSRIKAR